MIKKSITQFRRPYWITAFFDNICEKYDFFHAGEPEIIKLRGIFIPCGIGKKNSNYFGYFPINQIGFDDVIPELKLFSIIHSALVAYYPPDCICHMTDLKKSE